MATSKKPEQGQQEQSQQKAAKTKPAEHQQKPPVAANADDKSLAAALERRKIDFETWKAVKASIFPGAKDESILLAFDYCAARNLDIMKKPCHIVGMSVYDAKSDSYQWRDVIMPGIAELRMTAFRTGLYVGLEQEAGETKEITIGESTVNVPEYIKTTVIRLVELPDKTYREARFPHIERFIECCATKKVGKGQDAKIVGLNSMWSKRPIGQMEKCSEAGALRKAFPEEIGNEYSVEEMEGKDMVINSGAEQAKPSQSDAINSLQKKLVGDAQATHVAPDLSQVNKEPVPVEQQGAEGDNKEWLDQYEGKTGAASAEGGEQAQE